MRSLFSLDGFSYSDDLEAVYSFFRFCAELTLAIWRLDTRLRGSYLAALYASGYRVYRAPFAEPRCEPCAEDSLFWLARFSRNFCFSSALWRDFSRVVPPWLERIRFGGLSAGVFPSNLRTMSRVCLTRRAARSAFLPGVS